jgi:site-specific DNA-cytosine methylase
LFGDLETTVQLPKDKGILLKNVLEEEVDAKYFLSDKMILWLYKHAIKRDVDVKKLDGNQKSSCLTETAQAKKNLSTDYIIDNTKVRSLTPIECERLQTVKDNYTNHVSDSQRYKMLGNGWTVDVIAHFFKYMK